MMFGVPDFLRVPTAQLLDIVFMLKSFVDGEKGVRTGVVNGAPLC